MQGEMYLKKLEELQKMISGMIAEEKSDAPSEEMPMDMEGEDSQDMPEMAEEMSESEDMMGPQMEDDELAEYLKPKEKKKPSKGTVAIAIGLKGKK